MKLLGIAGVVVAALAVAGTAYGQVPAAERNALIAFYHATGGPDWIDSSGWLGPEGTECSWSGVWCSGGRVSTLQPLSNNLVGTIPDLSALTQLEFLDLSFNDLTGIIPELSSFTQLEFLDLSFNDFTGIIPDLSALSHLQVLSLGFNRLSGIIPDLSALSELVFLLLTDNNLTGSIPDLSALGQLERLGLDSNNLTGPIPPSLGDLSNLDVIGLSGNALTGSILPKLGNLPALRYLRVGENQLSGGIPRELGDLIDLRSLYLDSNQLSGRIPPELGNLTHLDFLYLDNNQLSGSIPPELGNLSGLGHLSLGHNQLTGSMPAELGNLTNLQNLYLDHNQLTGSIPPGLGRLSRLWYLYLDHNQLSGSIPPELGDLFNLKHLYLNDNRLSGSVPAELATLVPWGFHRLQLHLQNNQLSGSLPPELGNLEALSELYAAGNQLSGEIPDAFLSLTSLRAGDGLDLCRNALFTNDPTLSDFLDSKQVGGDWQACQGELGPCGVEPRGQHMSIPELADFGFKVWIINQAGAMPAVRQEAACIPETVCASGAVPGRSEVFLRVVGPKPNGYLWPTLVKFSTSEALVWVRQWSSGECHVYTLAGASPGNDVLVGLVDRDFFLPAGESMAYVGFPEIELFDLVERRGEQDPPDPPVGPWFTSPDVPDFRFFVRVTNQQGEDSPVRQEPHCIDQTICVSAAVEGRSEVFLRVVGPKPNGYLWPTIVRFSSSKIQVWIQQISTGQVKYYLLEGVSPGNDAINGVFDRLAFLP